MGPMQLEVLIFGLGDRNLCFALGDVLEVLRAVTIEPLPRAPAIVEGVINLRGEIVPVLDLRARFALPSRMLAISDYLIVVSTERRVAVRVERCLGIAQVEVVGVDRAPNLPQGVSYVAGFALVPSAPLVITDLRAFLSEAESLELSAALAGNESQAAGVPA